MLIRSSKPWKIQYVVTDIRYNAPLDAPEPGMSRLSPTLLRKLKGLGVRTTGQADRLLRDPQPPRPAGGGRGHDGPTRSIALAQRYDLRWRMPAIPRPPGVDGRYQPAANRLTTTEKAALRRYVDAANSVKRQRYQSEKPRRHPLFTPRGILNAPDIENRDPEYYFRRVPPAEVP